MALRETAAFVREAPVARGTNNVPVFLIDTAVSVPTEWLINSPRPHRVEVLIG
jgi:hypothetical protein